MEAEGIRPIYSEMPPTVWPHQRRHRVSKAARLSHSEGLSLRLSGVRIIMAALIRRRDPSRGTVFGSVRSLRPSTTNPPLPPPVSSPWAENELHTTTTVRFTPLHCTARTNRRSLSADVGAYTYGLGHPMKPQRMRMTHELVSAYDMLDQMHVLVRCLTSDIKHLGH